MLLIENISIQLLHLQESLLCVVNIFRLYVVISLEALYCCWTSGGVVVVLLVSLVVLHCFLFSFFLWDL